MGFDLGYFGSPELLRIVHSALSRPELVGCGCWCIRANLDAEAPVELGTGAKESKERLN